MWWVLTVEVSQQDAPIEYSQVVFLWKNMQNYQVHVPIIIKLCKENICSDYELNDAEFPCSIVVHRANMSL